ncbi:methylase [Mycolicibacterium insubricum]|jgi:release factor glutamine methyltransferase|uniref:Methylase n=1 Tax=Mycolicibacterium insubricum TaxID=444597 RepID=A0A1X0DBJ2_9MYCO|nr:HemK2/MTQ2 family protein methyltransferase [Mycolicibacterium insubricum]MCV7082218.1 methyltransferase [Mycolicibacterium insubricum]ORA69764.1 methylase [Mycolicibacterium insubricum]BBZ68006.1 methylase [Mycolicibacterium insubricum]
MTTAFAGVYRPQQDSHLLIDALSAMGDMNGRRVADLGTGTGVVALAAAGMGAESVTAFDISASAVRCARANIAADGAEVTVRLGSWTRALECDPFDVVLCNPPYVPVTAEADEPAPPAWAGPRQAWDGGEDGRRVLDPLCAAAPEMLSDGGTLLVVQSEYAGIDDSLGRLRDAGLQAKIVAAHTIPFGPVLFSVADGLQSAGRLAPGRRTERLVVIRADKP